MDLKWLEDLVVLLDEKSFTRAAQHRNVTQPAFSRRIRLLEEWLGISLADRSSKPIKLSPAGLDLEHDLRDLVNRIYALRVSAQAKASNEDRITFIAQHTLAVTRFPKLIQSIKRQLPDTAYRVNPVNNYECEALFLKGGHFLLGYETQHHRFDFTQLPTEKILLPSDRLLPVASKRFLKRYGTVTNLLSESLPMLMYQNGGFLAEALNKTCLPKVLRDYRVEIICESGFSASLKEMALADMGIGWLSQAMIEKELKAGTLISLEDYLGSSKLEVVLYYRVDKQSTQANLVYDRLLSMQEKQKPDEYRQSKTSPEISSSS